MAKKTVASEWEHIDDDVYRHKELGVEINVDPDNKNNDKHVEKILRNHNLYTKNIHSFVYSLRKRAKII